MIPGLFVLSGTDRAIVTATAGYPFKPSLSRAHSLHNATYLS